MCLGYSPPHPPSCIMWSQADIKVMCSFHLFTCLGLPLPCTELLYETWPTRSPWLLPPETALTSHTYATTKPAIWGFLYIWSPMSLKETGHVLNVGSDGIGHVLGECASQGDGWILFWTLIFHLILYGHKQTSKLYTCFTSSHACVENHGIHSLELLFHNHGSRLITWFSIL